MDILKALSGEHRRLERLLSSLERAAAERSPEAFTLGQELYWAFVRHERFEDLTLFRELREAAGDVAAVRAMESDHEGVHAAAVGLRRAFEPLADKTGAFEAARRFSELFREHIQREEQTLFPLAARTLGSRRLAELGREAGPAPGPRSKR